MSALAIPIDLDSLPPRTRSWIIAKSASEGIDPRRLAHDVLIEAAKQDGYGEPTKMLPPAPFILLNSSASPDAPSTSESPEPPAAK